MIEIGMDPNIFVSGSITLSWHGFLSFVAVAMAVFLVARWAAREGVLPDVVYATAIWAIIGGVIGARIVHVVDFWSFYQQNPAQILAIWSGGIGLFGAILGGFIGGAIYAMLSKYPVGKLADATAPALLFVQAIGRVGDVINGEHITKATSLPWGLDYTHPQSPAFSFPTQHAVIEYEMIWNMIALWIVWRFMGRLRPHGMLFALYLALYSVGRFSISFLRDDRVWMGGLQEAHFIALIILAITIPLLVFKTRLVPREETAVSEPQAAPRARLRGRFRRRR